MTDTDPAAPDAQPDLDDVIDMRDEAYARLLDVRHHTDEETFDEALAAYELAQRAVEGLMHARPAPDTRPGPRETYEAYRRGEIDADEVARRVRAESAGALQEARDLYEHTLRWGQAWERNYHEAVDRGEAVEVQLDTAVNELIKQAVALGIATRELSALSSDKETLMTAVTHWRERAEIAALDGIRERGNLLFHAAGAQEARAAAAEAEAATLRDDNERLRAQAARVAAGLTGDGFLTDGDAITWAIQELDSPAASRPILDTPYGPATDHSARDGVWGKVSGPAASRPVPPMTWSDPTPSPGKLPGDLWVNPAPVVPNEEAAK